MIFRRFAGNLRRQDWTAVVVELVAVVAGVFIGLQVSNWNANRQTDARTADFSQRLHADLRVEAWEWTYEVAYAHQVLANAKRAANALSGNVPFSDQAMLSLPCSKISAST